MIACAVNNLELAENKIIEAIAETSAPLRPIEDMLAEIPAKGVPAIGSKVGKKAVGAPKTAGAEVRINRPPGPVHTRVPFKDWTRVHDRLFEF